MSKTNGPNVLEEADTLLTQFPNDRFDPVFLEALARSIENDDVPGLVDERLRRVMVAELRRRAGMLFN